MAGSKTAPVVRGAEKARTGKEATGRSKQNISNSYQARAKTIPKWNVTEYKPPRKITDQELEVARKMFFELDRDGSGSIDAEELGMMLRSLGQNPTDEELEELINSVDEGDKDGQIQLREFLKLYTQGLDAKKTGQAGKEDVVNVFWALGGDPLKEGSVLEKGAIREFLLEHYELEMDGDVIVKGDTIGKGDLETFLTEPKTA